MAHPESRRCCLPCKGESSHLLRKRPFGSLCKVLVKRGTFFVRNRFSDFGIKNSRGRDPSSYLLLAAAEKIEVNWTGMNTK
jgi:hypothetical protein